MPEGRLMEMYVHLTQLGTIQGAILGGAMIGLAAVVLLAADGRIAGICGIIGGLTAPVTGDAGWRIAFLIGLLFGAPASVLFFGVPAIHMQASLPVLIVAGLLVGFGTSLGNGCTSGHGVCGLARGSGRSLTAVLLFMATAVLTVFVVRHVVGG